MKKFLMAAFVISLFSGCLKPGNYDTSNPACTYDACGVIAPSAEIQAVKDYLTANGIVATQHCSGLFYIIDNPGTGAIPTICNTILITYQGSLTNGTVFDQTTSPVALPLSQLIRAFQNGIPFIKAGGRIRLYVPPSLGYGSSGYGSVPANSILIFSVDLLAVQQ